MKYTAYLYLLIALLSPGILCAEKIISSQQKSECILSRDDTTQTTCKHCGKTECRCKGHDQSKHHDEHTHEEEDVETPCDQCDNQVDDTDELQSKCDCGQSEEDDKNKGCCGCGKQKCDCSEHADDIDKQDATKCENCPEGDPIEETTQLVLQAAPAVLNSFIKIVQDPNNKDTVAQSITNIVANIAAIAASAFKGKEREIIEQRLRQDLKRLVVVQVLKLRKSL